jgi:hypothetical protein
MVQRDTSPEWVQRDVSSYKYPLNDFLTGKPMVERAQVSGRTRTLV